MSLSEAVPVFSHSRPVATVYLVVGDRRRLSGLDSRGPVFCLPVWSTLRWHTRVIALRGPVSFQGSEVTLFLIHSEVMTRELRGFLVETKLAT